MSYKILDWVERPNGTLTLGSPEHLKDFDMAVVETMAPDMTAEEQSMWLSQTALERLTRPKGFHGRIDGVSLVSMDDAFDRLVDAYDRDKRFTAEGGRPRLHMRKEEALKEAAEETRGYAITVHAFDDGNRSFAAHTSEAWYLPAALNHRARKYFTPLRRIVTVPELGERITIEADEENLDQQPAYQRWSNKHNHRIV
jgi:hypothetical protein